MQSMSIGHYVCESCGARFSVELLNSNSVTCPYCGGKEQEASLVTLVFKNEKGEEDVAN